VGVKPKRKKPAIEEVKELLVQLNDTLNWIPSGLRERLSDIEQRISDVEARIHTLKSVGFEKLRTSSGGFLYWKDAGSGQEDCGLFIRNYRPRG
jgi:hypothetical protein